MRTSPPGPAAAAPNSVLGQAEAIVATVREPLLVLDGQLRVQSANRAFYRTFQVAPEATLGRRLYDLGNGQWDIPRLRTLLEEILPRDHAFEDFEVEHDFPGIGPKSMLLNARRLRQQGEELILLAIEDVTERRRLESERRELETRFTSLVKNIKDHAIFTLDPQGQITSWNIAAEHVLGYTEAEALGRNFALIFTPEDQARGVPEAELRAAREHGRAEDERWHLRKDGEPFWALGIVSALHDAAGRLTGFSKILRDMTERKRGEQALREREKHSHAEAAALARLAEASSRLWRAEDLDAGLGAMLDTTIALMGADFGNIQLLDGGCLRIAVHRGFGADFLDFFREVSTDDDSACGRALRGGERVVIEDVEQDPGFAPLRPVARAAGYRAVVSTPILGHGGRPLGMISTHFRAPHRPTEQDLRRLDLYTRHAAGFIERCRVEAALREGEERLRLAIEGSKVIIYECDLDLRYTWIENPIDGFDARNTVGRTDAELLLPEDARTLTVFKRGALASAEPLEEELLIAPDGSPRWYMLRAERLTGPDGGVRGLRVLAIEITARKTLEHSLLTLNQNLQQQADQLRALASQLTQAEQRERARLAKILHDHIQQLIVAARMQAGSLQRDPSPERRAAIARGLEAILTEALEASRSLAVELSPPVLEEAGLIGALHWLAARMQAQHGLAVRLRTDVSAEPATQDVRFLLFECIRELLLNAVKHSGVAEVEVTLVRHADSEIRVVVRDAGQGFDPETLASRRLDQASFGLFSIQQRLVHLGGRMEIESAPGRGTRVTLVIPAPRVEPAAGSAPGLAAGEATPLRLRRSPEVCRVLIVDDHQMIREGLLRLFDFESDLEVVGQAGDGPEAIAAALALSPDVVLMDVNLGEMDGIEATRRILARQPGIKVIGLSMHEDKAVIEAMRDAGAVAYLTKGGCTDDLIDTIRACIAG